MFFVIMLDLLFAYWFSFYWLLRASNNERTDIKRMTDENNRIQMLKSIMLNDLDLKLQRNICSDGRMFGIFFDGNGKDGWGVNINPDSEASFEIWELFYCKEKSKKKAKVEKSSQSNLCDQFIFFPADQSQIIDPNTLLQNLKSVAEQISTVSLELKDSWNEFIDYPNDFINPKVHKFDKLIRSFLNDYDTREEFLCFKSFARIIGDLDTEIENEIIPSLRSFYKKAKKYHFTNDLCRKLLRSNDELLIFINSFSAKHNSRHLGALHPGGVYGRGRFEEVTFSKIVGINK